MSNSKLTKNSLEILEGRIAPAALLPSSESSFIKATLGAPVELKAGQVLSTTGGSDGGYLLFVEQGNALVFFTDFNNNRQVDFNEITGISAGDGLRMIAFTDIHGDIVTNLRETTATFPGPNNTTISRTVLSLSDSDSNAANDSLATRGDGRVLLNNTIEKIEMRSLQFTDIEDQNGDGLVDDADIGQRKVPSTYSIFGSIYAGKGFGVEGGGLIIDSSGGTNFGFELIPTFGSIKTGTAASGEFYSFGTSRLDDSSGTLVRFTPPRGQAGGDIVGVGAAISGLRYVIDTIQAGDGGVGGRGGDIKNVALFGDDSGGYRIIAGNGGGGPNGGAGGSILNFSDAGSSTGQVVIRSGVGGTGATGSGGNGGGFSFENFNLRGNVVLELGDGGDGFTKGGDGASLSKGDFVQPDISTFLRGNAYGTTHLPTTTGDYQALIGTHQAVDFDGDGFGDFAYTTLETSQVVVLFGDGVGGFRTTIGPDGLLVPDRIYLSGVRNPEALTVGDLNADGRPDIAVASNDLGSHQGVAVFLSKIDPVRGFVGFESPRFSTMPLLATGDPLTTNAFFAVRGGFIGVESPVQISSLAAGDFDGDGRPEIAVMATYYTAASVVNGVTTALGGEGQVLMFLTADREFDNITQTTQYTGTFYADFGSKGFQSGNVNEPPAPRLPFISVSGGVNPRNTVVMEATALSTTSTYDVIVLGLENAGGADRVLKTYDYSVRDGNLAPVLAGTWQLGKVDTNRQTGPTNIASEDVTLRDFTLLDYNADGNTDAVVIADQPSSFLVAIAGDGLGAGAQDSGGAGQTAEDQAGFTSTSEFFVLKSADVDGDGSIDEVGILTTLPSGNTAVTTFTPGAGPQVTGQGFTVIGTLALHLGSGGGDFMFDVHHNDATVLTAPSFGSANQTGGNSIIFNGPINPLVPLLPTITVEPLFEIGLKILAGDGGSSSLGSGGKGGSLGGGATLVDIFDPVTGASAKDLVGSLNFALSGDLILFAGAGGDGFANGGRGGDVTGITLRYRDDGGGLGTSIAAGVGGRGVSGSGGAGGDIFDFSLETALISPNNQRATSIPDQVYLTAGLGGAGAFGGRGGSILGNKTIVADAITSYFDARAGAGGAGTKQGGNGGSVADLAPTLRIPLNLGGEPDFGQAVLYYGGDGGNSVSGKGGRGGDVTNSAPRKNAFLSGPVYMQAGDGGSGASGGDGGSVTKFQLSLLSTSKDPTNFDAIAGHAGSGFAGKGGTGGNVENITVPSRGLFGTNRVLAGNGGSSAAGTGGDGGNVVKVVSSSVEGAFAMAAGAGGTGLFKGGKGGSILNAEISMGASTQAKVLAIAGAGGDATAFVPNPDDPTPNQVENAFGGRIGKGGNGGSIDGFIQRGSTGAHTDLIAGNGGSTTNYGYFFDPKIYVGRGGSVSNINVSGDIGNIAADIAGTPEDENVPIKSYNNIFIGETIVDFIEVNLRSPVLVAPLLTDADGNVGIVVGAAGRNKAILTANGWQTQPAAGSINGSIDNLSARNLMSAVAGSVDRIAAVQVVKGVKVVNGIIGADKGSFIAPGIDPEPPGPTGANKGNGTVGFADYLGTDADTLSATGGPVRDGALIDGAVYTGRILDDRGNPTTLDGRVFLV
jgi:hypothetical protein